MQHMLPICVFVITTDVFGNLIIAQCFSWVLAFRNVLYIFGMNCLISYIIQCVKKKSSVRHMLEICHFHPKVGSTEFTKPHN